MKVDNPEKGFELMEESSWYNGSQGDPGLGVGMNNFLRQLKFDLLNLRFRMKKP